MNEVTVAYWLGGIVCGICGFGVGWILGRKWGIYLGTATTVEAMLEVPGVQEAIDKETNQLYMELLEEARRKYTAETERSNDNAEEE